MKASRSTQGQPALPAGWLRPQAPGGGARGMLMRRFVVWFFLTALLVAQGLAAVHGVAHTRIAGNAAQALAPAQADPAAGAVARLFAKHDTENDCRLFDKLASADAVFAALSLPAAAPSAALIVLRMASQAWPPCPAPFAARAPPSTR